MVVQLSFIGLHWARGTPIWEDQGEFEELTVWEQVDNGIPWTMTKKVLMIIPVILCVFDPSSLFFVGIILLFLLSLGWGCRFIITCHATDYSLTHLVVNGILNTILVVAKLPEMHKVRIFGFNSAKVD